MSIRKFVRSGLRSEVLGEDRQMNEGKNVSDWWERLPGKRRTKVLDILGIDKAKDVKIFDNLDDDEQVEVRAFFEKHKGKVEEINNLG